MPFASLTQAMPLKLQAALADTLCGDAQHDGGLPAQALLFCIGRIDHQGTEMGRETWKRRQTLPICETVSSSHRC
jgi:hypothetical protein